MKAAVIGTIMAWTGGLSNIPDGWIICDGTEKKASDYPLLVQAIGDTYNNGPSNLGGAFPNYTQASTFVLPNLTDGRHLMDIEPDYFAGGSQAKSNSIDSDPDAANLIVPLIGENTDGGNEAITTVFAGDKALKTDVEFTLNVREGYGGNIRGNTVIDGIGERTVYVGGRKLGHTHIRSHTHSGSYDTVNNATRSRPGAGVVPWDKIEMRWGYRAWNNTEFSDTTGGVDEITAIYRWYYSDTDIELVDASNMGSLGSISGFGQGLDGRSLAATNSENPPINLSAQSVVRTPLTSLEDWQHRVLSGGSTVNFAQGGGTLSVPSDQKNYYGGDTSRVFGTLLSNSADDFASTSLVAHGHDPFVVEYDQGTLKPNSRLVANATIPTATLDNAINVGALEIIMNTNQPSLTCVYIIRAY